MGGQVIVIGGGAAGALAALSARRSGARVTLVRKAPGATAVSSGAFDFASGCDQEGRPLKWLEAAKALARWQPRHPYARLGSSLPGELARTRGLLVEELAALGVRGAADESRNLALVTPLGSLKEAALAQGCIARGDLGGWPREARLGIVGVRGHAATEPSLVVSGLGAAGRDAVAVLARVELDPLAGMGEVAALLDGPTRDAVLARVALAAREAGATHLLVPTAGLQAPDDVCDALCALGFVAVAERISAPPSLAGLRLERALVERLERAGVTILNGQVTSASAHDGRVRSLCLSDGRTLAAEGFVLATGRFLGGGIAHQERFCEVVLDLPVFVDGRDVGDAWVGDLLDRHAPSAQPALRAGVRVDARMRPLDERERVVFGNVFAAGAVAGGHDAARDATGLGVAAVTALVAGEGAAAACAPASARVPA